MGGGQVNKPQLVQGTPNVSPGADNQLQLAQGTPKVCARACKSTTVGAGAAQTYSRGGYLKFATV